MYHGGQMDGACDIVVKYHDQPPPMVCAPTNPQYRYVTNAEWDSVNHYKILDPYFQIANSYGFANKMFQTNQGPSFPAHQFLFSGTSAPVSIPSQHYDWFAADNVMPGSSKAGCIADDGAYSPLIDTGKSKGSCPNNQDPHCAYPCYDHPTMANVLDTLPLEAPPRWLYYAQSAGDIWTAPNAITAICGPAHSTSCAGGDWDNVVLPGNRMGDKGAILTDIAACRLARVSWVVPDGHWSDHAGELGHDGGPSWVAAIVNAIGNSWANSNGRCDYWGNHTNDADATAILIVWDDWGGWYDHVPPVSIGYNNGGQQGKQYVYGFRVPLLVVSRYSPQHISSVNHDFGSILNFIEYVFGQGGSSLSEISPSYHFADHFAPDAPPTCQTCTYSLSDFFDFNSARTFSTIQGAKYAPDCFHQPATSACFGTDFTDADPDDDVVDDD